MDLNKIVELRQNVQFIAYCMI